MTTLWAPHSAKGQAHCWRDTATGQRVKGGESTGEHFTRGLELELSDRKRRRIKQRRAEEGERLCSAEGTVKANAESRGRWTGAGTREGWAAGSTEATAGGEGHREPQVES